MKLHFHSVRRGHFFSASPEDSKPIQSQTVILISVCCLVLNAYFSSYTNSLICPLVFFGRYVSGNGWHTEAGLHVHKCSGNIDLPPRAFSLRGFSKLKYQDVDLMKFYFGLHWDPLFSLEIWSWSHISWQLWQKKPINVTNLQYVYARLHDNVQKHLVI